jgi:hypothetical protein
MGQYLHKGMLAIARVGRASFAPTTGLALGVQKSPINGRHVTSGGRSPRVMWQ